MVQVGIEPKLVKRGHCEERSDEATSNSQSELFLKIFPFSCIYNNLTLLLIIKWSNIWLQYNFHYVLCYQNKIFKKRRGRTQDDVAFALTLTLTLSGYENGVASRNRNLISFSGYFTLLSIQSLNSTLQVSEVSLRTWKRIWCLCKRSNLRVLTIMSILTTWKTLNWYRESKAGYNNRVCWSEYIGEFCIHITFLSNKKNTELFNLSDSCFLFKWLMVTGICPGLDADNKR